MWFIGTKRSLRISKWFNMAVFFLINFLLIILVSVIRVDSSALLFNPSFSLDLNYAFLVVSFTFILQLIFIYSLGFRIINEEGTYEIYPKNGLPDSIEKELKQKEISRQEIVDGVKDVGDKSNVKVSRIYLSTSPEPNAFSIHLPLLGSLITVNKTLVDLLDKKELNSAIAHEVGHIKEHDSLLKLLFASPSTFLNIAFLYLYILLSVAALNGLLINHDLFEAFIRGIILFLVYIISKALVRLATSFLRKGQNRAELLADIHAANVISPETTINMLIHLGQRTEMLNTMMDSFTLLNQRESNNGFIKLNSEDRVKLLNIFEEFPMEEADKLTNSEVKTLSVMIYILKKFYDLRDNFGLNLKDNEIMDLTNSSTLNLINKKDINITIEEHKVSYLSYLIFERKNGSNKNNIYSVNQIHRFVDDLYSSPQKLTFRGEKYKEHPVFRERVMKLYHHFYNGSDSFH